MCVGVSKGLSSVLRWFISFKNCSTESPFVCLVLDGILVVESDMIEVLDDEPYATDGASLKALSSIGAAAAADHSVIDTNARRFLDRFARNEIRMSDIKNSNRGYKEKLLGKML